MKANSWKWKWARRGIRVRHAGGKKGTGGPLVKLARMAEYFPDHPKNYNLVYACYGFVHRSECRDAREKGIPVVYHMNSCWHPAYAAGGTDENEKFRSIHNEMAEFIVYGSEFARRGALKYLGSPDVPYEIIYNGVDTELFAPVERADQERFVILIAGRHDIRHRIEPMLKAFPEIKEKYPQAILRIAGECLAGEGIRDCRRESFADLESKLPAGSVGWTGPYSQQEAPGIYADADVLVHMKHMDWTPNVVAEAMASGLPVVHAGNGGLSELVAQGGLSVDVPEDWEHIREPDPDVMTEKIIQAWTERAALGRMARERAEKHFSMAHWIERHLKIFRELLR